MDRMRRVRYLITGGSGYIGNRLAEVLSAREETEKIINVDVNPPPKALPKTEFVKGDVRDAPALRALLETHKIDSMAHLAFLLNPIRDEALMYDVDVNGTEAVLRAAKEAGTKHVMVTTSSVAYGAWPDNPNPIPEDWPVRGIKDFSYARDKAEADRLCQLWALENPDRVMTIVRPSIVFGPGVDNFIIYSWTKGRFMPLVEGSDYQLQLVHNDDCADALILLFDKKAPGAYNVAADGLMPVKETADMVGLRTREMSFDTTKRLASIAWRARLPGIAAPPGYVDFAMYPWVIDNSKLKALGWTPKFDTRQTFEATMRANGKLK
jgi:UDP-glucose 4-epimerase